MPRRLGGSDLGTTQLEGVRVAQYGCTVRYVLCGTVRTVSKGTVRWGSTVGQYGGKNKPLHKPSRRTSCRGRGRWVRALGRGEWGMRAPGKGGGIRAPGEGG
eukprot:353125-Chlamydomonas_euryale.AAC.8